MGAENYIFILSTMMEYNWGTIFIRHPVPVLRPHFCWPIIASFQVTHKVCLNHNYKKKVGQTIHLIALTYLTPYISNSVLNILTRSFFASYVKQIFNRSSKANSSDFKVSIA